MNTQQQLRRLILVVALGAALVLAGCSATEPVDVITPSPTPTSTPTSTAIYSPPDAAIAVGDVWVASLRYVNSQTPELCAAIGTAAAGLDKFDTGERALYKQVRDTAAAAAAACTHALDAGSITAAAAARDSANQFLQTWSGLASPAA
jgi:hypothetical protein